MQTPIKPSFSYAFPMAFPLFLWFTIRRYVIFFKNSSPSNGTFSGPKNHETRDQALCEHLVECLCVPEVGETGSNWAINC